MSNAELEFSSITFRQGYIKLSVRQDVVEHVAPMMPAPFAVRAANDLMMNKAAHLIHERENHREKAMHEDNKAKGRSLLPVSRRRFVQGLAATEILGKSTSHLSKTWDG
jgi:hypothetical protein